MRLTIATGNGGKYKQITSQLPDFVHPEQVDLDLPEVQTNLLTVISRDKCIQAYQKLLTAVLVDDSGIFFHAFDNFPGALAKFVFEGMGLGGMKESFAHLKERGASMQCVLSYMDEYLEEPLQFVGETLGEISFDWYESGKENPKLPFESIFVPQGWDKPAALDQPKRLGAHHHRMRASKALAEWLAKNRS